MAKKSIEKPSDITVPATTGLAFDEGSHTYRLDGVEIPSITAIMRPLSDAHYGGIDEDVMANAANRGTAIHHAVETFLAYGIDDIPAEYAGYYGAFKRWLDDTNPTVIAAEQPMHHRALRYAGTPDLICSCGGAVTCVDFKSSSAIVDMLVRVQLEAYARALGSHGIGIGAKIVVHLRKDGSYKTKGYDINDAEAYDVFSALFVLRSYLHKSAKGSVKR